jgi:hypothetical protein
MIRIATKNDLGPLLDLWLSSDQIMGHKINMAEYSAYWTNRLPEMLDNFQYTIAIDVDSKSDGELIVGTLTAERFIQNRSWLLSHHHTYPRTLNKESIIQSRVNLATYLMTLLEEEGYYRLYAFSHLKQVNALPEIKKQMPILNRYHEVVEEIIPANLNASCLFHQTILGNTKFAQTRVLRSYTLKQEYRPKSYQFEEILRDYNA